MSLSTQTSSTVDELVFKIIYLNASGVTERKEEHCFQSAHYKHW